MFSRLDTIPACDRQTDTPRRQKPRYAECRAGESGLLLQRHEVYSMDDGDPDIIPRHAMDYGSAYHSAVELVSFALGAAE